MDPRTQTHTLPLTIATWNANGLRQRKAELESFLDEQEVSILMVGETFLKRGNPFMLRGFRSFRLDREGRPGGGVAIFFRSSICAERVTVQSNSRLEAIGLRTEIDGKERVFIAAYNPPSAAIQEEDFNALMAKPGTIVGGDLNAKDPRWGSRLTNSTGLGLRRLVDSSRHVQILGPEDATFIPVNPRSRGDVLDIFLTTAVDDLRDVRTVYALSSDHFPVLAQFGGIDVSTQCPTKTNWVSFSWLMGQIQCPVSPLLPGEIDADAEAFTGQIQQALVNTKSTVVPNLCNRLGLNNSAKSLVRLKNRANTRCFKFHDPRNMSSFKQASIRSKTIVEGPRGKSCGGTIEETNAGDGPFWKLLPKTGRLAYRRRDNLL